MAETATSASVPLSGGVDEHNSGADHPSHMKDYDVKWISWNGKKTATIMQNLNGPCPMIALINVLLLSNRIKIRHRSSVRSEHLIEQLGDLLLNKEITSEEEQLNYERNIADVITVFPKLLTGIDVNIQFKNVNSFELTPELTVFDAFGIDLFHGWLPDPQMEDDYRVISGESYNQLVDKIITSKTTTTEESCSNTTTEESSEDRLIHEGLICENFLESYPAQLTYHGLVTIYEKMSNNQLAVFFRNNHFSTIYKHKEELFTLVTDRGYLNKCSIVWETLSVTGDTHFTDGQFMTSPTEPDDDDLSAMNQAEPSSQQPQSATSCSEQLDRQLALELDRKLNPPQPAPVTRPRPAAGTGEHQQQQRGTVANRTRRNSSSSKCVIT